MRAPGWRTGPRPGRHWGGALSGIRTQARRGGVSPAPAAGPPESPSSGSRRSGVRTPSVRVCVQPSGGRSPGPWPRPPGACSISSHAVGT